MEQGAIIKPRYNVAPTQTSPVVRGGERLEVSLLKWGNFVTFRPGAKPVFLINARSETAAEKMTFRKSVQERRCVVPADGFFEWQRSEGGKVKVPFHFRLKDERPFWIAGLHWPASDDQPERYILLTTGPNKLMEAIHDRMPVIMDEAAAREWVAPSPMPTNRMAALCVSYPEAEMIAYEVSAIVNNARNDALECVTPVNINR